MAWPVARLMSSRRQMSARENARSSRTGERSMGSASDVIEFDDDHRAVPRRVRCRRRRHRRACRRRGCGGASPGAPGRRSSTARHPSGRAGRAGPSGGPRRFAPGPRTAAGRQHELLGKRLAQKRSAPADSEELMTARVNFDFTGTAVLVTGGTSGIGHATATLFRDAGAAVTVTGTKPGATDYGTDLSGMAYRQLQITDHDSVDALVANFDRLDVLVNNAG